MRMFADDTNNTNEIKYSVIIPTYNRSRSIVQALDSVVNQTISFDQYEIIVVDDGPTDDTESHVTCYMSHVTNPVIRYFKIQHAGSAAARNFGIKQARGEIIFFTDDDCVVPKNWMETLLDGYRRYPDVVGAGGRHITVGVKNRFFQNTANFLCKLSDNNLSEEKIIGDFRIPAAFPSNVSFKKSILIKTGGFDEKIPALAGPDLKYRILHIEKKKMLYMPTTVVHRCDLNFWKYLKKFFRQGRCIQYMNDKYFSGNIPIWADVTLSRVPKKILKKFYEVRKSYNIKIVDLLPTFLFYAFEVVFNSLGGFYQRVFNRNVYK